MRRQLHLRLYFAFLGVLLAVTVITAVVNFMTGRTIFGLLRGGPRMAAHVGRMLPPEGDVERALDEIHDELGVDLAVVDRDGRMVAQSGSPIEPPEAPWLERARHGQGWLPGRLVGGPIRSRPGAVVLVRIPVPGSAIWRPVLLLLAVLLVSFGLVYPLSRSITRPVEKLTAVVEAYGRGDFKQRSGLGELQDEVGQLARTFDEMADRIEDARRAEKELLANVSHELRTPLARIKVAVELIDARDEATVRRLAGVSEEVDELNRLVGDVLTAARLEASSVAVRRDRVELPALMKKAQDRAHALDPSFPVEIRGGEGLAVAGDEGLLSRALDNLIDNARKYGKAPITVDAARDGAQVALGVGDRGTGFAPDDLERVFEPFFRGNATRGTASGFGLGLALVKRVAEAHGGSARALNDGGARIELRLPVAEKGAA